MECKFWKTTRESSKPERLKSRRKRKRPWVEWTVVKPTWEAVLKLKMNEVLVAVAVKDNWFTTQDTSALSVKMLPSANSVFQSTIMSSTTSLPGKTQTQSGSQLLKKERKRTIQNTKDWWKSYKRENLALMTMNYCWLLSRNKLEFHLANS
jgi:hypothetical protein